MNNLLKETWTILKENSNLYIPPFLLFIIGILINPNESQSPNFILIGLAVIINIVIEVGWINQINVALINKKSKFEDFLIGIGKYSPKILLGSLLVGLFFLIVFIFYQFVASMIIGTTIEDLLREIQIVSKDLNSIKENEALVTYFKDMPSERMWILMNWSMIILSYSFIAGIGIFFISLWQRFVIMKNVKIFDSIKESINMITKNMKLYVLIVTVHSFFLIALLPVAATSNDFFSSFLLTLTNLIIQTYFTILYCLFVFKFDRKRINIVLEKDNDLQRRILETEKPDNKE